MLVIRGNYHPMYPFRPLGKDGDGHTLGRFQQPARSRSIPAIARHKCRAGRWFRFTNEATKIVRQGWCLDVIVDRDVGDGYRDRSHHAALALGRQGWQQLVANSGYADATMDYTTSNLTDIVFRGDAVAGAQTLWVRAYDGTD